MPTSAQHGMQRARDRGNKRFHRISEQYTKSIDRVYRERWAARSCRIRQRAVEFSRANTSKPHRDAGSAHPPGGASGPNIHCFAQFRVPEPGRGQPGPLGSGRAFLYQNGVMTDLNTLIPAESPWYLQNAASINEAGEIAGYGTINGETHAFLAKPVIGETAGASSPPGQ